MSDEQIPTPPTSAAGDSKLDTAFFGHPKGLQTLFFTEMWERMSYYGMRAMLVLFMTASLQEEGLAFTVASAAAIYGLYTGAVYFLGLPGGWISDRLLGGQRTVWYGGIVIMIGHIILAIPHPSSFFIGLIFVATGTGLLKPNISAMVGQLYKTEDERRDSGYAIYYMGINLGSMIGYGVCGYFMENVGWHWAFGAAAVGMAIGLVQYRLTQGSIRGINDKPANPLSTKGASLAWTVIGASIAMVALTVYAAHNGWLVIDPVALAGSVAIVFTITFFIYFGYIYFLGELTDDEKQRMWALFLVCVASACFWSGFEQAGSSLNLFARDYTDRMLGSFEIPTAWFQSANSFFIIILSPFFAALWINLAKRMITPSYSVKCAVGLIIMATGFLVMFFAAQYAADGLKVAPYWLITTYFLHTVGELCLSPVALSAVSRLSPARYVGQMMGVFVLTYSIGNIISGLLAGSFDPENVQEIPGLYMQIALFSIGVGIILVLFNFKAKYWERAGQNAPEVPEPNPSEQPAEQKI
ncbi:MULTISPECIES: peptide MFS transporter [Pseudoalteromonas]|uniref:MFS transporter n=1 Tax=Pseudoalteromonas ruthenica TaxID=151081 RepID=A0A5S3ZA43_9GAMM|nr:MULTISPECIES: peptide MFS transporter [Pseudoalteromonas]MCF2861524.1 peptide MFS transporter [Pseudoalteromonas sp. CNAT2-18]MCG7557438.1 peptide MFS transporter [Pseudoalteromonas sp. CNAT2-18.1]MCG7565029.1 peptide MFS transporter [Pseudoalteromonas sp. CnMc7-15]MCG7568652.1 peptide MFS transporter [Pseudoalteromonas sp. CNC9-20]QFU04996.1 Di-/tripeptide transporter [Pseudoalteromonas sp. THAF3]|tara:strand:- start:12 stop:1589 length:1578 start_codon:yes stop_codon:yes gene_type:complete